jgi:hypothetical protein
MKKSPYDNQLMIVDFFLEIEVVEPEILNYANESN